MHNGMTPKDAGHVILNLFNLWEPCTELTFESLSLKQNKITVPHTESETEELAPARAPSSHCCLTGLLVSVFPPHNTGPEVAILSLGGEPRNGSVALALYC